MERLSERANSIKRDDYEELLHGESSKNIPIWANYKIGYQIMMRFIENNPDVSIDEWTVMDAKEIVEQSGLQEDC